MRIPGLEPLLACTTLVLCLATPTQAQGWRGIKPLHSTRQDVERLIGPPMRPNDGVYDLKSERVRISYADVPCTEGWPFGWNVKPGTVVGITISPQPRPKLAELPIDISKATEYVDPSGFIHYNNDDEGLSVAVDPHDYEVRSIEYYPALRDHNLRCPEAAARQREIDQGESIVRLPDVSYSSSKPENERWHLNAFADQLKISPSDARVFIIGYAGKQARLGEAQARADKAKKYLIEKRGIDPERIVTIDGGYKDPISVELFITPRGKPKPLASPNIYPGNVKTIKDKDAGNNRRR